jgi:hypothetical protein
MIRNNRIEIYASVRQISIQLFYLYQRLSCRNKYFFQIKFAFFLYLRLSASSKENDLPLCIFSNHVNSDHAPSFSCLDVWTNRQATSGVYAITVTTSAYHSRRYFAEIKYVLLYSWRVLSCNCILIFDIWLICAKWITTNIF